MLFLYFTSDGTTIFLRNHCKQTQNAYPTPSKHLYAPLAECTYGNASDGYFLMRPSTSNPNNPLTLVLWCRDRVYNVPVRRRPDNRYALGSAKPDEQSFASIDEIVPFYKREKLVLYTGGVQTGSTRLSDTPGK